MAEKVVICYRAFRKQAGKPSTLGSPPSTPSRGFTLIELMVVMALLTVAVALTIPRLASFFRGRALDSEGRRLLAFTRYAQDRAVSEGIPMRVWFDTKNGTCGVERDPSYEMDASADMGFDIDTAIRMEVPSSARRTTTRTRLTTARKSPESASKYAELPAIQYLPDGTIEENSPERVTLRDTEDHEIVIERSANRLTYELSRK